ncbi:MAG: hypothetical protein C4538_02130 [Nitrospiraceae bacterium]|nr:MAG: hypothetical protein C4538_02130 [Nitrospiraceae bacterium]
MDLSEKMKSNINSLQEAAQQFTAKGDYDNAIAAWKKIISVREDANFYNTIGDLYIKKGSQNEALEFFTLAADKFKADGFHQKAMAIYKKLLNIVPFDVHALASLGELHADKGLVSNSVMYYLKAAEKLSMDGDIDKSIDIYEKILLLTPSDISVKTKIAELWLSRGLSVKAANDFAAIASGYMEKDDFDKAVEFFSRAIGVDPQNVASFIGLGSLAEKRDNLDQALEFTGKALLFSQNNKDILTRYVQLAVISKNTGEARNILSRLIMSDPADIFYKKLLAYVYISEGQSEKAWEELLPGIDELLQDQSWDEAYELIDQFRELFPVPVKQRLVTIYRGRGDSVSLAGELDDLAKIYESQGLNQNALVLFRELAELRPDDASIKGKIDELELMLELKMPLPPGVSFHEAAEISIEEPEKSEEVLKYDHQDKRAEAEFYANQGLVDEAVRVYEEILASEPDNMEIRERIESLLSVCGTETATFEAQQETVDAVFSGDDQALHETSYDSEAGEEDIESHYTAGIEYKQKGLLDDAIKEFQIVAKDPGKTLLCTKMIALCYMEKGVFSRAISELTALLDTMSDEDERGHDIKYELAGAYMKNNDYAKALEIYSEIHRMVPDYRDVTYKLDILKDLIEKSEEKQKTKKNRISYI